MEAATSKIILSQFDRRRLEGLLRVFRQRPEVDPYHLYALERELARAEVVSTDAMPAGVVTMNSRVALRDPESGAWLEVCLAFPGSGAGRRELSVPVLSPLGVALLGRRVGDVLEWNTAEGPRRFCIERLLYQPEAEGHHFC